MLNHFDTLFMSFCSFEETYMYIHITRPSISGLSIKRSMNESPSGGVPPTVLASDATNDFHVQHQHGGAADQDPLTGEALASMPRHSVDGGFLGHSIPKLGGGSQQTGRPNGSTLAKKKVHNRWPNGSHPFLWMKRLGCIWEVQFSASPGPKSMIR